MRRISRFHVKNPGDCLFFDKMHNCKIKYLSCVSPNLLIGRNSLLINFVINQELFE